MICIRIFKTRKEAEVAKEILKEGGIYSFVDEDVFNGVSIQKFGVSARFRLKVESRDLNHAARFLATKLKKAKESKT